MSLTKQKPGITARQFRDQKSAGHSRKQGHQAFAQRPAHKLKSFVNGLETGSKGHKKQALT
jgi:hypothetical protein